MRFVGLSVFCSMQKNVITAREWGDDFTTGYPLCLYTLIIKGLVYFFFIYPNKTSKKEGGLSKLTIAKKILFQSSPSLLIERIIR